MSAPAPAGASSSIRSKPPRSARRRGGHPVGGQPRDHLPLLAPGQQTQPGGHHRQQRMAGHFRHRVGAGIRMTALGQQLGQTGLAGQPEHDGHHRAFGVRPDQQYPAARLGQGESQFGHDQAGRNTGVGRDHHQSPQLTPGRHGRDGGTQDVCRGGRMAAGIGRHGDGSGHQLGPQPAVGHIGRRHSAEDGSVQPPFQLDGLPYAVVGEIPAERDDQADQQAEDQADGHQHGPAEPGGLAAHGRDHAAARVVVGGQRGHGVSAVLS